MVNGPYFKSDHFAIHLHEHSAEVRVPPPARDDQEPPPTRGACTSFSKRSRLRLIKTLCKLQSSRLHQPHFVTLTWHHSWDTSRECIQGSLNQFLTEFRRDWPGSHYLWRLEWQRRGAPHFHLIIWAEKGRDEHDTYDLHEWCRETWHRIADPKSGAHHTHGVDCRQVTSWREAYRYVCKYTSKLDNVASPEYKGRRWAKDRKLPTEPVITVALTSDEAWQLKRILRKMIAKRSDRAREMAKNWKRPQSLFAVAEMEQVMHLMDIIVKSRDGPEDEEYSEAWMARRTRQIEYQKARQRQGWKLLEKACSSACANARARKGAPPQASAQAPAPGSPPVPRLRLAQATQAPPPVQRF